MIAGRSLDPTVRQRLFAAATEAFGRDGYEGASLNGMLTAAGVGKSTFFYYFHDKMDLFASVLADAYSRVLAAAGPIDLPDDPSRFFAAVATATERWGVAAIAEPGFLGLLRALHPMRRTAGPGLRHAMGEMRGAYRALLARGVELGVVRRDIGLDTMIAFVEAVDIVLDDELHRDGPPDAAAIKAHRALVVDTIQRLIQAS